MMLKLLIAIFLVSFVIIGFVSAQQECLSVSLPREEFLVGETFQAEISISNPLEDITLRNVEFFLGNRKISFPVRITKVSDELYYAYFTISQAEGDYRMKVKTICMQERIVGVESMSGFRIEKEKIGNSYQRLAQQSSMGWGNTEENAFSVLALKGHDSALAEQGVQQLLAASSNGECWPAASCRVKDTAFSLITLEEMGKDTLRVKNWLDDAQNSLSIGGWELRLEAVQDGSCQMSLNEQQESIALVNGMATRSLRFGNSEIYNLRVTCNNLSLTGARVSHSYLGRVVDFPLEMRNGSYTREFSNEKCWGILYRGGCNFEATAFAHFALSELGENSGALAWLEQNRNDVLTQHQIFLNLFKDDVYFKNWLISNQASLGYWLNTSITGQGNADVFLTSFAIFALKLEEEQDNRSATAVSRGKAWLLGRISELNRRDLAAALYFAFSPEEIKDIVAVTPAIFKKGFNESAEILIENKGIRKIALEITNLEDVKEIEIERGSFVRYPFRVASEENYILTISYSGLYNIPIFVTKIIGGREIINSTLELPQIRFYGEANETLMGDEAVALKLKLVNSNSRPLENVFLLLTSDLYKVVRVEPSKVNLPANGEIEILLVVNEEKDATPGKYVGEIRAKNSITASMPVSIEILASDGGIEKKETCTGIGFQCCERAAKNATLKPELDSTCASGTCASACADVAEERGIKVSPVVWIILAIIFGSIILVIILKARSKTKPKEFKDVVSDIEGRWKGSYSGKR